MLLGWIKLHRQLLDNWIMTEPEALSVWVRFLLEANHDTKKKMLNGSLVEIKRGQLVFGLEAFSARSGVSIAKLRRYIKLLESDGMINRLKTAKYSIITIASFDSYQSTDKQTASKEQSNNKQIATPKECKNENNVNKDIYQQIADAYNEVFPHLPQVVKVSQKRKSHIAASVNEFKKDFGFDNADNWKSLFYHAAKSDYLMGKINGWSMNFDFVINKTNLLKIIEGNYDNV